MIELRQLLAEPSPRPSPRGRGRLVCGRCRRGGFTLVELIAVMLILGLIASVTGTMMWQVSGVRDRAERSVANDVQATAAFRTIMTHLRNLYRPLGSDYALFEGRDETEDGYAADTLRFFTIDHRQVRLDQPESDIKEVEFELDFEAGSATGNALGSALMMRIDPTRNESPDGGGVRVMLADNVLALDFVYFDGVRWQDQWSVSFRRMPEVVRVRMTVVDERGQTQEMSGLVTYPYGDNLRSVTPGGGI